MTVPAEELLVSTQWLADHLEGAGREFALIDAGEAEAYRRAHIPGAVGAPQPYLKGRDNPRLVMTAPEFEVLAGRLGVGNDTPVVIYDGNSSRLAARVWWVFEYFGHRDVRVVDGGFNAWLDEGRAVTSVAPTPAPATFTARPDDRVLCRIDELRAIVAGGSETQIWDVRSDEEWTGATDRGNTRAGHVPGAVHLEWHELVQGPPARRFRPPDELRALLERAGINPEAETVVY